MLALLFIVIVGLFATVALNKSQTTLASGQQLRERGILQYALDGGIERALQVLQDDVASGDASKCTNPDEAPYSETVAVNGRSVTWTCSVQAGRTENEGDGPSPGFALVITSTANGVVTSGNAVSAPVRIGGSVFVAGSVTDSDLRKELIIQGGDFVAGEVSCPAPFLDALTQVTFEEAAGRTGAKRCSTDTADALIPAPVLPVAGPLATARSRFPATGNNPSCRIHFPGRYTSPPDLGNGNNHYFVSGVYEFVNVNWEITGNSTRIIGGQPGALDGVNPFSAGGCSSMTDAAAIALLPVGTVVPNRLSHGVTFVMSGNSAIDLKQGQMVLNTPQASAGSRAASIVGYRTTTNGYSAYGSGTALTGFTNNSALYARGLIYLPRAAVDLRGNNASVIRLTGGLMASTVAFEAPASVGDTNFLFTAPPGPEVTPPGFRTVTITTTVAGTTDRNQAVATISNEAPGYDVAVRSWRTD